MLYSEKIAIALKLARIIHKNDVDKSGVDYIYHPIHLAEQCNSEDEVIVALLHDAIEDHPECREQINQAGFSSEILEALEVLNRNSERYTSRNLSYYQYIEEVSKNSLAARIKLLDLKHNMDPTRGIIPDTLLNRYTKAYGILITRIGR